MMLFFADFLPLVLAIACGQLSDSAAVTDRAQLINCSYSILDITVTKKDSSHDKCCCTNSGECTTFLSSKHFCDHNIGEIRPLTSQHRQRKVFDTNDTATNDLSINCPFSPNDIPTTKSHSSHDKCCCTNSGECTTFLSATHYCDHSTGDIRPLPPLKKSITTSKDLSINCPFSPNDIPTTKSHSSHDKCCCTNSGECTTFLSTTHYCDHNTGDIRPLPLPSHQREPLDLNYRCPSLSSAKSRASPYLCCRNDTAYLPDVMSCNLSSGEVTLKSSAIFETVKLCRKKLPRALDSGPAPSLRNKEIHIEGRVEKVRVDIGANYLIIDLLPFRLNSTTKNSVCSRQSRGRLQVMVMLPPKQWCQPLDEVQEYLYDKTLDIWTDFFEPRHCRSKLRRFQIPHQTKNYWMMVSRRDFYLKQ